jgi:hypothetical protein
MAMRYIKMWGVGAMHKTRLFKWEWRVVWRSAGNTHLSSSSPFSDRKQARQYKSIVPELYKPRLQRRLVQAHWDDV